LREAQSRINQLELEADGVADRMSAKLQSDANARIDRAKQEADARIARVEAEAESRVRHFQAELAQAKKLADRAKGDAQIAQERIARAETEANELLRRAWAEIEDRFIRLKADLAQAELRANRAEQWLVLIRRKIEDHLMPSLAAMHDLPIVTASELSGTVQFGNEPLSFSIASDVAFEDKSDHKS
jgi:hypothetical protein